MRIYSQGTVDTTKLLNDDGSEIRELAGHVTTITWILNAAGGGSTVIEFNDRAVIKLDLAPLPLLVTSNAIPGTANDIRRRAEALMAVANELQRIEDENVKSGKWQRTATV